MDDKAKSYLKTNLTKDLKRKQKRVEVIEKLLNNKNDLENEKKDIILEIKELQRLLHVVNNSF